VQEEELLRHARSQTNVIVFRFVSNFSWVNCEKSSMFNVRWSRTDLHSVLCLHLNRNILSYGLRSPFELLSKPDNACENRKLFVCWSLLIAKDRARERTFPFTCNRFFATAKANEKRFVTIALMLFVTRNARFLFLRYTADCCSFFRQRWLKMYIYPFSSSVLSLAKNIRAIKNKVK